MPYPTSYFLGDCSNCQAENVLVHSGIHGRAKFGTGTEEDRTSEWCEICRGLIRPEEEVARNLAYCTHLLLKALKPKEG